MPSTSGVTTTELTGWTFPEAFTWSVNSPRMTGVVWRVGPSGTFALCWEVTVQTRTARTAQAAMAPMMTFLRRRFLRWARRLAMALRVSSSSSAFSPGRGGRALGESPEMTGRFSSGWPFGAVLSGSPRSLVWSVSWDMRPPRPWVPNGWCRGAAGPVQLAF